MGKCRKTWQFHEEVRREERTGEGSRDRELPLRGKTALGITESFSQR